MAFSVFFASVRSSQILIKKPLISIRILEKKMDHFKKNYSVAHIVKLFTIVKTMLCMARKRERPRNVLKTAILGDGGVGKTTFTRRCVEGIFDPKTKITVGIEFHLLRTKIIDPFSDSDDPPLIDLEVQIWDFGGEDRFRFMLPRYCQGAVAGLLLYDASRYSTTKDLPEWLDIWRNNTSQGAPIFLVGTKKDLLVKEDEVEEAEKVGSKLALQLQLPTFDLISSKTKERVDLVLNRLITEAYKFNMSLIEKEQEGDEE